MTNPAKIFVPAAALAVTVGVVVSWWPALVAVIALVALLGWGLWTPSRLNYALFAVLFLVPVTADPGYPTEPVWVILLGATLIAGFGRLQRFHPDTPLASPGMLAFVVPAVAVLAALVSWSGPKDLVISLVPFVCYALITWHVVDEARREPAGLLRLARAFAWVGVPVAVLAMYQRVSGTWPLLDGWAVSNAFTSTAGEGRSVGTVGHPIVYGAFCLMAMCIAIALRGRMWQVPFAASAIGLLLSGSRSAWIGMAFALVVWYLGQERKVTRRGLTIVFAFAVAGTALLVVRPGPVRGALDILTARLSNVSGSSSATARYSRYDVAWSGLSERVDTLLFGLGPEAHVRFFQQVGIGDHLAQTFDNSYLTLWYDFGLITVAAFVALLIALFATSRSLAARLLVVGIAAQIFFFDVYLWPCAVAVLILAAGLATAERSASAAAARPSTRPHDTLLRSPLAPSGGAAGASEE
ncbi:O-antigen ligase family protein [Micromonospora gifhornensis]|uniref:O-antigen ligase-related domain-containing protein n=1 Tax=Micromonospora gifhornensis TaxID=84594 RepID=A0ABQ4IGX3_9ACTN|nr:O-antigen ligase family protein [Micromonospora gifhornensis]GIJ16983.1 hypothetical protein Vgi01_36670 [Micromonospora gifhornensis]